MTDRRLLAVAVVLLTVPRCALAQDVPSRPVGPREAIAVELVRAAPAILAGIAATYTAFQAARIAAAQKKSEAISEQTLVETQAQTPEILAAKLAIVAAAPAIEAVHEAVNSGQIVRDAAALATARGLADASSEQSIEIARLNAARIKALEDRIALLSDLLTSHGQIPPAPTPAPKRSHHVQAKGED